MQKKGITKVVSILFLVSLCLSAWSLDVDASGKRKRTKHIVLFIGDGMQLEHEIAASRYFLGRNTELLVRERIYKGYMEIRVLTA